MQKVEAHVYFSETIGMGDWFYGTTLQDVRYIVEGQGFLFGEPTPDNALPTTVYLHFPACQGGDVVEGYAIYNYVRQLAAKGVKTVARIEGLCASIAVLCAIACDTVEMADAALVMVHKPSSDGWNLNADDMRAGADLLDKIQAQLVSRYVARCGMDAATATELINKTTWLTADECIAYGFVGSKIPDAPIVAPAGTEAVLNYYPKSNPAPTMATMTEKEEKGFMAKVANFLRDEFGLKPKNEEPAPTPTLAPVVTNTSVDVTGGEPMYYEGTLGVDSAVYSDAEMATAYADGSYTLADNRTATVLAGLITALADAEAENAATGEPVAPATNAAPDEALIAENTDLKAENALLQRQLTAAKNKLKATVPGSAGAPTAPGSVQNVVPKTTPAKNAAGSMFSLTPPSTSNRK